MFGLVPYLSFFTFGLGLLFCFYLSFHFVRTLTTWFLIFLVISLSYTEFYMYALGSKLIMEAPILFRTGFPFRMMFGPLLYVYVRTMLYPEEHQGRKIFLHFIPALLITVLLIPDYFAPNSFKLEVINNFYERNSIFIATPSGLIPPGYLPPFVILYGLGYCLASYIKIRQYRKSDQYAYFYNSKVVGWVYLFTIVLTVYISCQLIQFISLSLVKQISSWTQIFQSLSLLSLMAYLLISQDVLDNMDGCLNQLPPDKIKPLIPVPIDTSNAAFIQSVEQYVYDYRPYLNPDFAINEMAAHFGSYSRKLSVQLGKTYGMHFNEWVNRYRINYLIEILKEDEYKNIKLEALIFQSGFHYRSSFYAAFKKIMKSTPSAFLKSIEKRDQLVHY
jgi:AraC-like DNA-binding protein